MRGRDGPHVEAATTGFVSQGLREVRFSDTRQTLDRLTVELTIDYRSSRGGRANSPVVRRVAIGAFQIFE